VGFDGRDLSVWKQSPVSGINVEGVVSRVLLTCEEGLEGM
jgi:hypothetical protein